MAKPKSQHRSESRRQEVKRQRRERQESLLRSFLGRAHPASLLIGVGFSLGVLAVQFWGSESMPWARGQRVERDVTARVDFVYDDREQARLDRQSAQASTPNVYVAADAPLKTIRGRFRELYQTAIDHAADPEKFRQLAGLQGFDFSEEQAAAFLVLADGQQRSGYEEMTEQLIRRLRSQYIVSQPTDPNRRGIPESAVMRTPDSDPDTAPTISEDLLIYIRDEESVKKAIRGVVSAMEACPEPLVDPLSHSIERVILGPPESNPLWRYSPDATAELIASRLNAVETHPIAVKRGVTLVEAGTVLGESELYLLSQEHAVFLRAEREDPELARKKFMHELGMAIMVLAICGGLAVYTHTHQPRIFRNWARALGLASLMLCMITLSRVLEMVQYPWDAPPEFSVFFLVMAAALLAIAYNQRFAFGVGGGLTILIVLSARGDFMLFLTFLSTMSVTVFLLREVRTRSKLVAVGAAAGLVAFVTSAATGMIAGHELKFLVKHAISAAGAALFAGFIAQGILHYFERAFGVATSLTLIEWCDASQPLLRRLAQDSPGTYSHSLVLSQMAEEACATIGANGLLARVGALYHDIGKTQKPNYFVENQEASMNRHDKLSPTMSLLIIVGHVKDGIEMARAYGLPRVLHQFIAEHHGTTVVKYFHHMASEAAAKNSKTRGRHDREVPDTEFRYPGPKPRSRETAILMICDGCEGAVRALSEPTPGRIETTVHQVVMERLNDGQFDECDITLRELNMVEQSVVKSLVAIHHGRIKYPKGDRKREPGTEGGEPRRDESDSGRDKNDSSMVEVAHQP